MAISETNFAFSATTPPAPPGMVLATPQVDGSRDPTLISFAVPASGGGGVPVYVNSDLVVPGIGGGGGGSSATLAALTDVQLSTLANGDLLSYSASLGKWTNEVVISLGGPF